MNDAEKAFKLTALLKFSLSSNVLVYIIYCIKRQQELLNVK